MFKLLNVLLKIEKKVNSSGMASQKKVPPKDRDKYEYELWVRSEEFKESND